MKRVLTVITGAVSFVVVTAAAALAQYPPSSAPGGGNAPGTGTDPGGLPFTGANISWGLVLVLALVLTGAILLFAGRRRRVQ
jgi:hypothetical protein